MLPRLVSVLICLAIFAGLAQAKNEKHQQIPPGLQKNLKRGKPLPPGWQKKLIKGHRLDDDIYHRGSLVVPVDNKGLLTIKVEGKLIRLIEASHEIVDILNAR